MGKVSIGSRVSDDGAHVDLTFSEGGLTRVVRLTGAHAEIFMRTLAANRAKIADAPPMAPVAKDISPTPSVFWRTEHMGDANGNLLPGAAIMLRHPGYGWLAFGFGEDEALRLARDLTDRANAARRT